MYMDMVYFVQERRVLKDFQNIQNAQPSQAYIGKAKKEKTKDKAVKAKNKITQQITGMVAGWLIVRRNNI